MVWKSGSAVEKFIPVFCFVLVCLFLGLKVQHMEVPRLGAESEIQPPAYTTATAMLDPSRLCNLYHSSWQRWILNPLSGARSRICILMDTGWVQLHWATMETPSTASWTLDSQTYTNEETGHREVKSLPETIQTEREGPRHILFSKWIEDKKKWVGISSLSYQINEWWGWNKVSCAKVRGSFCYLEEDASILFELFLLAANLWMALFATERDFQLRPRFSLSCNP